MALEREREAWERRRRNDIDSVWKKGTENVNEMHSAVVRCK